MTELPKIAIPPQAVLFDLDGTLIDTAPDLVAALNAVWAWRQRSGSLPDLAWRSMVSKGALFLIETALGPAPDQQREEELRYFLQHYEDNIFEQSVIFHGMVEALEVLRQKGIPLGVVTNKREALAHRLLDQAGLKDFFSVIIGGDRLPLSKPHPEPLWAACEALSINAGCAVMVGDDQRDITAAQNAGMGCVVAMWGYGVGEIDTGVQAGMIQCSEPLDLPKQLGFG